MKFVVWWITPKGIFARYFPNETQADNLCRLLSIWGIEWMADAIDENAEMC
jgi:hypothetical protein